MKKDPNRIARIEKAIAKKYGHETIENPRRHWNDEKEKEYQEQRIQKLCQECGHELEVDTMSADLICYKCGLCLENTDE